MHTTGVSRAELLGCRQSGYYLFQISCSIHFADHQVLQHHLLLGLLHHALLYGQPCHQPTAKWCSCQHRLCSCVNLSYSMFAKSSLFQQVQLMLTHGSLLQVVRWYMPSPGSTGFAAKVSTTVCQAMKLLHVCEAQNQPSSAGALLSHSSHTFKVCAHTTVRLSCCFDCRGGQCRHSNNTEAWSWVQTACGIPAHTSVLCRTPAITHFSAYHGTWAPYKLTGRS